jgi:hypothetical protein
MTVEKRGLDTSLPLGGLNLAPCLPSHVDIWHGFEETHIENLAFSRRKKTMPLCDLIHH